MAGKAKNLKGLRFHRWLVLERAENDVTPKGHGIVKWLCKCDCGTIKAVNASMLLRGNSKSCGCLQREVCKYTTYQSKKKYNDYEIQEDYVIMYTTKDEMFLVDLEDFENVRPYCWRVNDNNYIVTTTPEHKTLYLHRFIMGCPDDLEIDHRFGSETKYDNRKYNLRCATGSQNNQNRDIQSNNTSGYPGVSYHKRSKKWRARIWSNYQEVLLGMFDTYEEAVAIRKRAEDDYYKNFSYKNSRLHER